MQLNKLDTAVTDTLNSITDEEFKQIPFKKLLEHLLNKLNKKINKIESIHSPLNNSDIIKTVYNQQINISANSLKFKILQPNIEKRLKVIYDYKNFITNLYIKKKLRNDIFNIIERTYYLYKDHKKKKISQLKCEIHNIDKIDDKNFKIREYYLFILCDHLMELRKNNHFNLQNIDILLRITMNYLDLKEEQTKLLSIVSHENEKIIGYGINNKKYKQKKQKKNTKKNTKKNNKEKYKEKNQRKNTKKNKKEKYKNKIKFYKKIKQK